MSEFTTYDKAQAPDTPAGVGAPRYAGLMVRMYATFIDLVLMLLLLWALFPQDITPGSTSPELQTKMAELQQQFQLGKVSTVEYMRQLQTLSVEMRGGEAAVRTKSLLQMTVLTLYFIISWKWCRPTPGKRIFKLAIVDKDTLGNPTTVQAILRFLCYTVSALPLGLGFWWIAFDKKKRSWHDIMARTLVIHTKPLEEGWKDKRLKRQTILFILMLLGLVIYNNIVRR